MRRVRDRHVAGIVLVHALAPVDHLDALDLLVVARGDSRLDLSQVEHDDMVEFVLGHLGQIHPHLGVVGGREGVLALVVAVGVVEVARHQYLPGDLHGIAVDGSEDVHILRRIVEDLSVVDQRRLVLTVGEDVAGARVLLRPHPVDVLGVRNLDDLVALHHVAAHPRDAGVGLVVHEKIPPVIGALGERHVRMVQIAVVIGLHAVCGEVLLRFGQKPLRQNLQALVGLAPAGRRAAVEDRNPHQFAHRRHAQDAQLAGLARGPEAVVLIKLAGLQRMRGPLRACRRSRQKARAHAGRGGYRTGCRGPDQSSPGNPEFLVVLCHLYSSFRGSMGQRYSVAAFWVNMSGAVPTAERLFICRITTGHFTSDW